MAPNSQSGTGSHSATERLRQTAKWVLSGSRLVAIARSGAARVQQSVRASVLYRWLTAEPDPEVIVIDLRDTWTVGPFLAILDRLIAVLARGLEDSRVGALASTVARAIRASPLRVLGVVTTAVGAVVLVGTSLTRGATMGLVVGGVAMLVGIVLTRDERDWEALQETTIVELLQRALEPPEPPNQAGRNPPADDNATEASDPETRP